MLSRITRAAPKIANYPFTTLEPVLGTLDGEDRQLVIADIPGLIEGASGGAGLGHDFLAHVERTRLLVHVLDLAPLDGSDPEENFATIERELASYDPRLAGLPRILALSKADLVSDEEAEVTAQVWRERFAAQAPRREAWEEPADITPVLVTSSATGLGLDELRLELLRRVPVEAPPATVPGLEDGEGLEEHRVFRPSGRRRDEFDVEQLDEGAWRVSGDAIERLLARHDLENEEALAHVERRLHRMGVIRALEAKGFEPGDDVEIGGIVFELDPS
jgi:GTP-binding protein